DSFEARVWLNVNSVDHDMSFEFARVLIFPPIVLEKGDKLKDLSFLGPTQTLLDLDAEVRPRVNKYSPRRIFVRDGTKNAFRGFLGNVFSLGSRRAYAHFDVAYSDGV